MNRHTQNDAAMSRRTLLKTCATGVLCAAVDSAFGADDAKTGANAARRTRVLPDWAQDAIDETRERIEKWRDGQNIPLFVTITDVHSRVPDVTEPTDWSDPKSHILIAQEAARQLGADAMVDLGDSDFQYAWDHPRLTPPADEADALIRRRIAAQFALYRDFERPVYFCRGNHDRGRTHREFPTEEFAKFNALAAAHGHKAVLGGKGNYGYFDVTQKRVRLLFLDSCEMVDRGFTLEQMAFVAKGLESLPDGWKAVAMQHVCLIRSIGRWLRPNQPMAYPDVLSNIKNGNLLHRMFAAFVHSEAGEMEGVKWDFLGRPQRRFVCSLSGDSHFDNHGTLDDVNYHISQGYGRGHPVLLAPGASFVWKSDRTKAPMIDVLGVKKLCDAVSVGHVFRIGDGGAMRDREWCF